MINIRARNGAVNILTALLIEPLATKLKHSDLYASCLTCHHVDDKNPNPQPGNMGQEIFCKKYQSYPPLHIIVDGCEGYADNDEIPY